MVRGTAVRRYDGRNAAGEGLQDNVAEGVRVRGEDEEVHVCVGAGEGFAAKDAGEFGCWECVAKAFFFRAVADDDEVCVDGGGWPALFGFGAGGLRFFQSERRPT